MDSALCDEIESPVFPVEIFEYLMSVSCLSQLLALTEVNNMFKILAMSMIKKHLKKMNELVSSKGLSIDEFPITFFLNSFNSEFCKARLNFNELNIVGMSFILKILRLFGSQIKHLVCDFCGASEKQANAVFSYVSIYCSDINHIAFGNLNCSLKYSLERPFENVEYLFIQHCRLYDRLCKLNKYFPKVKEIFFSEKNKFENIDNVLVHYNSLKKVEICRGTTDIINAVFLQLLNPNAEVFYTDEMYNLIDF